MEIEISQEAHTILDKYCNTQVRTAQLELVLETIIRPWYAITAKKWNEFPNMIQRLDEISEAQRMKVNISRSHAVIYLDAINKLNKKYDKNIDPCALASWLVKMYARAFNLKELTKYKPDMGGLKKM
jgi:hypothetical protein